MLVIGSIDVTSALRSVRVWLLWVATAKALVGFVFVWLALGCFGWGGATVDVVAFSYVVCMSWVASAFEQCQLAKHPLHSMTTLRDNMLL